MDTKTENDEVVFLKDNHWLVTNKRICSPTGVFRLSEVHSAELVFNKNTLKFLSWTYRIGMYLAIVGMMGGCIYDASKGFADGSFESWFYFALFASPGIIIYFITQKYGTLEATLKLHCVSGIHTLTSCSYKVFKNGADEVEFDKHVKTMKEVSKAIGDALGSH